VRAWVEALPASTSARPALRRVCAALVAESADRCADALDGLRLAGRAALGATGDAALATLADRLRDASSATRPEPRP
jgi:sirohydrochlorin ferrochelatase